MALNLPPNPTPEQFDKAEPLLVQNILEQYYRDGIKPLKRVDANPKAGEFMRVAPGQYKGIFIDRDGQMQFAFEFNNATDDINYSPLNPEAIPTGDTADMSEEEIAFNEAIANVSMRTRLITFWNRGTNGLVELYDSVA